MFQAARFRFQKLEGQDEEHDRKGTLYHVPHFQKDTDAVLPVPALAGS